MTEIRFGILGAARIAGTALINPAGAVAGVRVDAIAARDPVRASAAAAKSGIGKAENGYETLLGDDSIDAVYIPLPNSLHGEWTIRALEAGKHVLCEKPFTANAAEARQVADVAAGSGLVVMEAFHYRYHPLTSRLIEIVRSGELGELRSASAMLCVPMPPGKNIRWNFELAGGSMMDLGCYGVHMLRTVIGTEPRLVRARAKTLRGPLDRCLQARLEFPGERDGQTGGEVNGVVTAAMWSGRVFAMNLQFEGTEGRMRVFNPNSPHVFARVTIHAGGRRRVEHTSRRPSYEFQLEAFRDAVRDSAPVLTDPLDAVANMTVIDAAYRDAGLPLRPSAAESARD
jgi:predicted dehydrogenase